MLATVLDIIASQAGNPAYRNENDSHYIEYRRNCKRILEQSYVTDLATTHRPPKVGERHGKPVILVVDAAAMQGRGHAFYQADNGVWLTDGVPPDFLSVMDDHG